MINFNPLDKVSLDELTPELKKTILENKESGEYIRDHLIDDAIHVTAEEKENWNNKADTDSPNLTGIPTAPNPENGVYDNKIATTSFVKTELDNYTPEVSNTANKLKTPINIGIGGAVTSESQEFDGSKDLSIPIKTIQASALLGTVPVNNLNGTYDINIDGTANNANKLGDAGSAEYAKLKSPSFTGTPKAPTAEEGNSSLQIANTEFVSTAIANNKPTALSKPRYFSIVGLATSDSVPFDGTSDVILKVVNIDGSKIENVNAATVNGYTVETNVPADASFNDTIYEHPVPKNIYSSDNVYLGVKIDSLGHISEAFEADDLTINITGNSATTSKLKEPITISYTGAITGEVNTDFVAIKEPVPETDEDGNTLIDEDGNIVYQEDEDGNIIYQDVEGPDVTVNITSINPSYIVQNENYRFLTDAKITSLSDKYTKSETDALIEGVISNIDWKETVETFVDLATIYPDAVEGWTASVKDTNAIYRYDGSNWINISTSIDLPLATEEVNGIMSMAMVKKLNSLEEGANNYIHPETHDVSIITGLATVATSGDFNDLVNSPTSLPANGGNADTVNGHTVEASVPANAVFTDTKYIHPSTHAASMIVQNETNRFVTDEQIAYWNEKAENNVVSEISNGLMTPTLLKKLDSISEGANEYIHPESGVIAGKYTSVIVNTKGHVTEGSNPENIKDLGITKVPSNIVEYEDSNIVKTYDRIMACFVPYNGITIKSPLITDYMSNPSTIKSLISIDLHVYIPSKANAMLTINIPINGTEIGYIAGLVYSGYIYNTIKVECVYNDNRFNIRLKSTDATDGDYTGFIAIKTITAMSYDRIESLGYMATDEWLVELASDTITNELNFNSGSVTPGTIETATECTGNSASATILSNKGWTIDVDDNGNVVFMNNGVAKMTLTTAGNIIASNVTEQ